MTKESDADRIVAQQIFELNLAGLELYTKLISFDENLAAEALARFMLILFSPDKTLINAANEALKQIEPFSDHMSDQWDDIISDIN